MNIFFIPNQKYNVTKSNTIFTNIPSKRKHIIYPPVFQHHRQLCAAGCHLRRAVTIGIPVWGDVMNKSTIANIHTLSSVAAMLLFLPFSSVLSKLAMLTVPNSAEEAQEMSMPVLDERLFKSPAVALQQAKSAVVKMSRRAARNVSLSTPLLLKMDEDVVSAINVRENLIDRMEVEISTTSSR